MYWIAAGSPNLEIPTELVLTSKEYYNTTKIRFNFEVKGVDRIFITVEPLPNRKLTDWSFNRTPIEKQHSTPYYTYNIQSMIETPLVFWIEIEVIPLFHITTY